MKFVAINKIESLTKQTLKSDEIPAQIYTNTVLRKNDVVCIVLNSDSYTRDGEPVKMLRIYKLPHDPSKTPPTFFLAKECPEGAHEVFGFADFGVLLYAFGYPEEFRELKRLMNAEEVAPLDVFIEFDKHIFEAHRRNKIAVSEDEAERLYEKASKCKARVFGTPYEHEAETSYRQAVRLFGKIIGLEVKNGKVGDTQI